MDKPVVSYELHSDTGIVRIDNPPVNALSQGVRAGIIEALKEARNDASKAVLLLCSGRTFIAGADIAEFGKPPLAPLLPEVIRALEEFDKPVIVVLHGHALGGGLEVALAAHYRCAAASTKLGLPEVKLGLLPGAGGTQRLPRLVGVTAALDMMTGGTPVNARTALQLGLVDRVLEGDLESAALEYARQLIAAGKGPRPTSARPIEAPPENVFADYRARLARKSRGQLAPGFIVDLVELATRSSFEEGSAAERERFLQCRDSTQSIALRHVFFAERAASKLPGIPAQTAERPVREVAVIGAGTMGGGIAMCFANAGIPVTLLDSAQEPLDNGMARVRANYETSLQRGRFSREQVDRCLGLITPTVEVANIASADVVIEAVFENMGLKKQLFGTMDSLCKPGAILATNTSYLDVNDIAASTGRAADVIGAHFFSPANVMKLLEVVRARETAPDVVLTFMALARRIGKVPVAVGVCHGFVGNRMLGKYARQAQLLLLEGATPQQVDGAMERWGMAMGPLAVFDLAGLDIGYRSRADQGIEPHSVMEFDVADTLVEMKRLGQKTGAGYYRYEPGARKREVDDSVLALIEEVAARWAVARREIPDQEIVDRLLLSLVNEGAAILEEKIAARPGDIDIVWINGYGFPAWRGGPMHYAGAVGLAETLGRLERLRALTGDPCWAPAPLLQDLLDSGRTLADLDRDS